MPEIYLSVGSNVEPERHLRAAAVALAESLLGGDA